jgi:hypothetical protein
LAQRDDVDGRAVREDAECRTLKHFAPRVLCGGTRVSEQHSCPPLRISAPSG